MGPVAPRHDLDTDYDDRYLRTASDKHAAAGVRAVTIRLERP